MRSFVEQAAAASQCDRKEKRFALRGKKKIIADAVAEVGHIF